jgi:WD40 repeat protein
VRLWNIKEKREEAVLEGYTTYIGYIAITNDNEYIVSGCHDKTVRIWKRETTRSCFKRPYILCQMYSNN